MPLVKSKSPEAFKSNLKAEMHAGKPMKQSLAIAYAMKRKAKGMHSGGAAMADEDAETLPSHGDIVDRIIEKKYSKGGMVANDTQAIAGDMPNEFDDLALRDGLEGTNSGAADGDLLGNAQEDEDRDDIVKRVMKSRSKKDRNPSPA